MAPCGKTQVPARVEAIVAIAHAPNPAHHEHVVHARRVLELPVDVSALRWHPFGVYTLPLGKRTDDAGRLWSRRMHVWHPDAIPVGETSAYGVHTHSGEAHSHVLIGALEHHLYEFEKDDSGIWHTAVVDGPEWRSTLRVHMQAPTPAGTTHILSAQQPHGVTTPHGFAISLFEQLDTPGPSDFTTWRRTDLPETPLVRTPPIPIRHVQREALLALDAIEVPA
jgi:hypothetical protein